MSSKVRIELNRAAVRDELLRSTAMLNICKEIAEDVKGRCGEGYEVDTRIGKNRVNAMVCADTPKAINSNNKHNTLLKAIGGSK